MHDVDKAVLDFLTHDAGHEGYTVVVIAEQMPSSGRWTAPVTTDAVQQALHRLAGMGLVEARGTGDMTWWMATKGGHDAATE